MRLSKETTVDYAHRLAHHKGQCANLHGHTGRIVVTLEGEPDPTTGMLMDFADLKVAMEPIRQKLDHATVLNSNADTDLIVALDEFGFVVTPLPFEPTAENLAHWIYNELKGTLPVVSVTFYETANNYATYEGENPA